GETAVLRVLNQLDGDALEGSHGGGGVVLAAVVHDDDAQVERPPLHERPDARQQRGDGLGLVERRQDEDHHGTALRPVGAAPPRGAPRPGPRPGRHIAERAGPIKPTWPAHPLVSTSFARELYVSPPYPVSPPRGAAGSKRPCPGWVGKSRGPGV